MPPVSPGSPRARTLAAVLREVREHAELSLRELGRRMGVAHTTIGRWENGDSVPNAEDVSALLNCLEIGEDERENILSLTQGSIGDDWLASGQPGITQQLAGVMDCERSASHVTHWEPLLIPGPLQTSAYARAVMARGTASPGEAEARVLLRVARRDAFTRRRDPTTIVALIGEPAILGGIGGKAVMADQLRHLLDLAVHDNITMQIVRMAGEWHPGHMGPFIFYEFENGMRPIVYLEHHRSGAFLVEANNIRDYRTATERIRNEGMSPEDSAEFIADTVKKLEAT